MLMYRITLFMFIFNLVAGFVADVPRDTMGNSMQDTPFDAGLDANLTNLNRFSNWTASAQNLGSAVNFGFGDIPASVIALIDMIAPMFNALPMMLGELGLPDSFVLILTSVTALIYVVGIAQIWSGRNIER